MSPLQAIPKTIQMLLTVIEDITSIKNKWLGKVLKIFFFLNTKSGPAVDFGGGGQGLAKQGGVICFNNIYLFNSFHYL